MVQANTHTRPNTNVGTSFLEKKVLICAGEDASDVTQIIANLVNELPSREHSFRCYRFWQYSTFTLVWTGIGTGCMEPLLHEILDATSDIEEIVLIGTAGKIPSLKEGEADEELTDEPFVLRQAYMGPTAYLAMGNARGPLVPSWEVDGPAKKIISTDLYYDYDPKTNEHGCELVDMEVAQFYHLCHSLSKPGLKYVALKGTANVVGDGGQQVTNAQRVLQRCAKKALDILGVTRANTPATRAGGPPGRDGSSEGKLMEEVKLYWTIQIGIAGVLGLLLSKIDPLQQIATATLACVSFMLVLLGTVTNPACNYYTFLARQRMGAEVAQEQEGIISSVVEFIYLLLTGICGAVFCWSMNQILPDWIKWIPLDSPDFAAGIMGFVGGAATNFLLHALVVRSLAESNRQYRDYVKKKWCGGVVFLWWPGEEKPPS